MRNCGLKGTRRAREVQRELKYETRTAECVAGQVRTNDATTAPMLMDIPFPTPSSWLEPTPAARIAAFIELEVDAKASEQLPRTPCPRPETL
eukprot:scaffold269353_cov37-Tisochrysis_lutea.AAC.1